MLYLPPRDLEQNHPLMLASVGSLQEALLALQGGAEVIDIKDARLGALGAAPLQDTAEIVQVLGNIHIISATVGDLPMQPELLVRAYRERAATGVSYVKLGLMPSALRGGCIAALGHAAACSKSRLVAVLCADRELAGSMRALMPQLAQARFAGVVVDTFDKHHPLLEHAASWSAKGAWQELRSVIEAAQQAGLFIGLAGSLRIADIASLSSLKPDLLGFRGALCEASSRTAALELSRVIAVRQAISSAALATDQEALA